MLGTPTFSGYAPLQGFKPQLHPESWLIWHNNQLILPENGIIWSAKPDFLLEKESAEIEVVGFWQGKLLGGVHLKQSLSNVKTASIRGVLLEGGMDSFAMVSHAVQVITARENHHFCGRCGAQNSSVIGEWAMHCNACNYSVYPRISPCIIVLVIKDDALLLVRHKRHGEKSLVHTVIAGFIEPGESAEDAVRREVMEEVGLQLSSIRYQLSQSWPFPHSLMLGFHAVYATGKINLDKKELCAGGWFQATALPQLPPEATISRKLINRFLDASYY